MDNFESIDDYLSERLTPEAKQEFEQRLASDASIKSDFTFQQSVIAGVKKARGIELKTMLNNVPLGGVATGGAVAFKIAAGIIAASVVGTVVYFTIPSSKVVTRATTETAITPEPANAAPAETKVVLPVVKEKPAAVTPSAPEKKITPAVAAQVTSAKVTPKQQPKIDIVDPSEEMKESMPEVKSSGNGARSGKTTSHIVVDTDATNKKFNFHYQFATGKLVLYGPFDKSLYEILEINGDQKSVFLFYKNDYYLLSDKQNGITPLVPIKDAALLKKLKEYQGG